MDHVVSLYLAVEVGLPPTGMQSAGRQEVA
jgi:hypothetical protein